MAVGTAAGVAEAGAFCRLIGNGSEENPEGVALALCVEDEFHRDTIRILPDHLGGNADGRRGTGRPVFFWDRLAPPESHPHNRPRIPLFIGEDVSAAFADIAQLRPAGAAPSQ